jgi:hypothetical protein
MIGLNVEDALNSLVQSPEWGNMSFGTRRSIIQKTYNAYRTKAVEIYMTKDPSLIQAYIEQLQKEAEDIAADPALQRNDLPSWAK